MKIVLNILAALLSVLLVITLIIAPATSFLTSVINKDNIKELITDTGLKEELADSISIGDEQTAEFTQEFMKSDCFDDLLTEITDYVFAYVYGDEDADLKEQDIVRIAERNMDELTKIFKKTTPEAKDMTSQQYEEAILKVFSEAAPDIINNMEELRDVFEVEEIAQGIRLIKNCHYIIIALIIVFTALIFLCTFRKFNGFIWLCVDYGVAALLNLTLVSVLNILFYADPQTESDRIIIRFSNFVADKIGEYFYTAIIIYTVLAVICLITAIICKVCISKRKRQNSEATNNTVALYQEKQPVIEEQIAFVGNDDN
ncbi:MAG: hypothetical protein IJZ94_05660 [Clostridia bacterium]|nr:hypothetical protein [Clostridia bacterium]